MAHHTIREKERLAKLSEGKCDLNDVAAIVERVVGVATLALMGSTAPGKPATRNAIAHGRLTRQDL